MSTPIVDDGINIPKSMRKPRGTRATKDAVASENPDDLATVDAKVAAFWDKYPEGAIDASDVEQIGDNAWRVTAHVWKTAPALQYQERAVADSTGSASRDINLDGHASGEFPLESAQSVAIGRALRFMGILATIPVNQENPDGQDDEAAA